MYSLRRNIVKQINEASPFRETLLRLNFESGQSTQSYGGILHCVTGPNSFSAQGHHLLIQIQEHLPEGTYMLACSFRDVISRGL